MLQVGATGGGSRRRRRKRRRRSEAHEISYGDGPYTGIYI
jgi:hypothetical protein